jgi:Flp pilus assembly protein TadG
MRRRWRDDRGEGDVAAMMFVIPLAMGLVMLFVYFGRQGAAAEGVAHASHVAAVAAARERDPGTARAAASRAAAATLASDGTSCAGGPTVSTSADRWEPGGVITVTVTCRVATGDLGAINAQARTLRGSSQAVIDTYRGYADGFSNSEGFAGTNSGAGGG